MIKLAHVVGEPWCGFDVPTAWLHACGCAVGQVAWVASWAMAWAASAWLAATWWSRLAWAMT